MIHVLPEKDGTPFDDQHRHYECSKRETVIHMKQAKSKDTAVLEAIARDLVAKQQAFVVEKQQQVQHKTDTQQQQS